MGTAIPVRSYRSAINNLEHASIRIRRLFAIAHYEYVKPYLRQPLDHVIKFASDACTLIDEDNSASSSFQEMYKSAIEEVSQNFTLNPRIEHWRSDIAYSLVALCVNKNVLWRELASIVWGIECIKAVNEFEQLAIFDDFDIIDRCHRWPTQKFSEITLGIAKACYDGDWDQRFVLADALEELETVPANWHHHLRANDRHWRGCWVIDNLLGKS